MTTARPRLARTGKKGGGNLLTPKGGPRRTTVGWLRHRSTNLTVCHVGYLSVKAWEPSNNESLLWRRRLAGYAYCAIGALYMLDRPPSWDAPHKSSFISQTLADKKGLVQFLVHRQFNYLAEQESRDLDGDGENFIETKLGDLGAGQGCTHVGWNGRWNKKADTCYSWWVAATLAVR